MAAGPLSWWRSTVGWDLVAGAGVAYFAYRTLDFRQDGSTLYQITAAAGIGLVAFVVTPVATLLTLTGGDRFQAFDRHQRPNTVRAMVWAFSLSMLLFVASIIGGVADSRIVRSSTVGLAAAGGLAVVRLFWFFVAGLSVRDADDNR